MSHDVLEEREFELINIIGAELGANQRDLSRLLNLSLGMVNMLVRRLISKGYIRIVQLNKKKVQYLLTPEGFSEKVRKSFRYTLKTINSIALIREHVKGILLKSIREGHKSFYIYSEADLTSLVKMVFSEIQSNGHTLTVLENLPDRELEGVLILGKEIIENDLFNLRNRVDLVRELGLLIPSVTNAI